MYVNIFICMDMKICVMATSRAEKNVCWDKRQATEWIINFFVATTLGRKSKQGMGFLMNNYIIQTSDPRIFVVSIEKKINYVVTASKLF